MRWFLPFTLMLLCLLISACFHRQAKSTDAEVFHYVIVYKDKDEAKHTSVTISKTDKDYAAALQTHTAKPIPANLIKNQKDLLTFSFPTSDGKIMLFLFKRNMTTQWHPHGSLQTFINGEQFSVTRGAKLIRVAGFLAHEELTK